jgi:hypothetical protein
MRMRFPDRAVSEWRCLQMTTDTSTKRPTGRPKGTPKTGGRRKGTPNRASVQNEVMFVAAERYLQSIAGNPAAGPWAEMAREALALRQRKRG